MSFTFKNLVFEGGGVKGIAYGGALQVMDNLGLLKDIQRVAGTSAGAINACLLSIGYTSAEVSDIIARTNFKDFEDSGGWLSNITRILNNYGFYKGDKFTDWLSGLVNAKTGAADTTFAQLKKMAPQKGFKDLYVVTTNLTQQRSDVFSYENPLTANVSIRDAVRMSMSIPLYFQAIVRDKDIIVDGGAAWNYPINLFDFKRYLSDPQNGVAAAYNTDPEFAFNYETLGFRLDSTKAIQYNGMGWASEPMEISNLKGYALALVNFLMEMANKKHLHQNDWNRTIFIDTLDVKTTDFKLPNEKIQALIQSGTQGTNKYFAWRKADAQWSKFLPASLQSAVLV